MHHLKNFDMFAKEFRFNIDGNSFGTIMGGAFSVLVGLSFFGLTAYFGKDIYNKQNPSYLFKLDQLPKPPYVTLTNSNFTFAFNLVDQVHNKGVEDKRVFFIEAAQVTYLYKETELIKIEKKYINISTCSNNTIQEPRLTEENFNKFKCFDFSSLTMGGDIDDDKHMLIELFVKRCTKKEEKMYNITCYSNEEIKNKSFALRFKIQKNVVDPNNYYNPIKFNHWEKLYYLNQNQEYIANLWYQESTLETDTGIIFEDEKKTNFIEYSNFDFRSNGMRDSEGDMFTLYTHIARDTKLYTRKYLKVPELIANVGGFIGLAVDLIDFFLSVIYIENEYKIFLYNQLLKLYLEDKSEDEKELKDHNPVILEDASSNKLELKPPSHLSLTKLRKRNDTQKKKSDKVILDLQQTLKEKRKPKEPISVGKCERLYYIFCLYCNFQKSKYNNKRFELIKAAEEAILKNLNILNLYRMQDQFNLFKKIKLTENQIFLLDNTELKCIINNEKSDTDDSEQVKNLEEIEFTKKKENLIKYLKEKGVKRLSQVDSVLWEYLDEKLRNDIKEKLV